MSKDFGEVTFTITNRRALKALGVAFRFVAEMADRYEYDPDAQRALRAAKFAIKNLDLKFKAPPPV